MLANIVTCFTVQQLASKHTITTITTIERSYQWLPTTRGQKAHPPMPIKHFQLVSNFYFSLLTSGLFLTKYKINIEFWWQSRCFDLVQLSSEEIEEDEDKKEREREKGKRKDPEMSERQNWGSLRAVIQVVGLWLKDEDKGKEEEKVFKKKILEGKWRVIRELPVKPNFLMYLPHQRLLRLEP